MSILYECLTSDELRTGVLVDLCHVDDGAGLLGIAQSAQAFLNVAAGRAECGYHGRLGVAAKAFFQQPAEEQRKSLV